ncbi:hypothetical protein AMELA_G00028020 [Ameiurus melas]|uniref:Zona pellucida sperm-binding protein 3 n=1 Tax=Ameiurus melas TaxID=219545 RepID=A0A7J6BG62_AMEME|nr:hypothetical protein AMELA_G00028020 [Ameiurus melas]
MGFNQVGFVVLLILAVGLSAAQWPGLMNVSAGLQANKPGHPSLRENPGLPSQWMQSGLQSESLAVAPLGLQLQNPSDAQDQQVMQRPVKKLTWRFPAAPQIPTPSAPVNFVRQSDVAPTQSVTARCNETAVYVEVKKDLFGTSAHLNIAALTLGGCASKGVDVSSPVLVYESPLHGCNSKLTVSATELVYIFTLDSCVATAVPDVNAVPRYSFIENHGCLIDAKLTQSSSRFMPQTQAAKLGFQLEAFKFQHMNSSWFYITCILKATAASAPADAEHKACSFSGNRWTAAYGVDLVCSCCSSSCGSRKGRDLSSEQGLKLQREVSIGPIMVQENVV